LTLLKEQTPNTRQTTWDKPMSHTIECKDWKDLKAIVSHW
jgi:hypothetical protein